MSQTTSPITFLTKLYEQLGVIRERFTEFMMGDNPPTQLHKSPLLSLILQESDELNFNGEYQNHYKKQRSAY